MSGTDRPDPEDDPFACSICGHPLHETERIEGHDYCRFCRREYGPDCYVDTETSREDSP